MIELDIDLSYLTKHFNIGLAQIQQYAKTRSIKEIVKADNNQNFMELCLKRGLF